MAILYANSNTFSSMGEKYIYHKILSSLTDDWHIFYEPIISGNKPDFVIFHPNYGLTIIEVKDYRKETILSMDPRHWTLNINGEAKKYTAPLEQAISYRNSLDDVLSKENILLSNSQNYKGKLKVPISTICCFTNISKTEQIYNMITDFIPEHQLIVKEDISDEISFTNKVLKSFERLFSPEYLSKEQMEKIIHLIFPRYIINTKKHTIGELSLNEILKTLPYTRFENYVEELLYVTDVISHWYNLANNKKEGIVIVYNRNRAAAPSAEKYIQLLNQLLNNKNIYTQNYYNISDKVLLITYDKFKELEGIPNLSKMILIDFNNVAFNYIKDINLPNKKNNNEGITILITSNEHIPI